MPTTWINPGRTTHGVGEGSPSPLCVSYCSTNASACLDEQHVHVRPDGVEALKEAALENALLPIHARGRLAQQTSGQDERCLRIATSSVRFRHGTPFVGRELTVVPTYRMIRTTSGDRGEIGMCTVQVSIELPREVLSALRQDPASFVREMRLAAAAKWYETHLISQGQAAKIAGLSRAEFLTALARLGVPPFQYDADEIVQEVNRG